MEGLVWIGERGWEWEGMSRVMMVIIILWG